MGFSYRGVMMVVAPVGKTGIEAGKAVATSEYEGQKYCFCATGCKRASDEDPEEWFRCQGSV
jgi:YHS domain-containing protein